MAGFFNLWSKTAASNANSDSTINWAEGQLPSTVNGSARAGMAALASFRDDINGSLTTAGSSNAYTLTANIAFTALATGLMVCFKANHTNTGAATLAVNSLTAKALRTQDDAAVAAGQIVNGGKYYALYDAAANSSAGAWMVLNPNAAIADSTALAAQTSGRLLTASLGIPRLLNSGTVSAASGLGIVLTSYTAFRGLIFHLGGFVPATDTTALEMLFSTDGGANYDTAGYNWAYSQSIDDNSGVFGSGSGSDSQIRITPAQIGNLSTEGYSGEVRILKQTSTALWSRVFHQGYFIDDSARGRWISGGGAREAAQDTDAVFFRFSSGNIASGDWAVYGIP